MAHLGFNLKIFYLQIELLFMVTLLIDGVHKSQSSDGCAPKRTHSTTYSCKLPVSTLLPTSASVSDSRVAHFIGVATSPLAISIFVNLMAWTTCRS
ncbi:hypothetical protein RND81_05G226400 [Saponaria officinalis]|uniref:Uncharacterized protein n=1 Tax=Saponaria officinalis TaxID=3572 RepID=A0AAW1KVX5_SAPOF